MNDVHFHFTKELTVAEIQLFVKVVKSMMSDQFSSSYDELLDYELPIEAETKEKLLAICKQSPSNIIYVSTPQFADLKYVNERSVQIANIDTSLHLSSLQRQYNDFKNNVTNLSYVEIVDKLLAAFICINTDLTLFFVNKADNEDSFSWNEKFGPCFFDRERFVSIRWDICLLTMEDLKGRISHDQTEVIAKCLLMSLLYQCGFLAFWCCLADVATFPGNTLQEEEVLGNLTNYLLKNYYNLYLYNLTVECSDIKGGDSIDKRGSSENTTRIKLYFTKEDGEPVLMRLDLPHEDCPFVHLNIEEGESNTHIPLSNRTTGNEYDHVFDSLSKALLRYDFNAADYYHSPVAVDKEIIKDMRFRTALFSYAPSVLSYIILRDSDRGISESHPLVKFVRDIIVELLEMEGVQRNELLSLSPFDLSELAYGVLFS